MYISGDQASSKQLRCCNYEKTGLPVNYNSCNCEEMGLPVGGNARHLVVELPAARLRARQLVLFLWVFVADWHESSSVLAGI